MDETSLNRMHYDFLNALSALEKEDGVIAFPTDTVYGLGCLPDKQAAVEKIYQIKGRIFNKPLILMASTGEDLQPFLGEMSLQQAHTFQQLVKNHWPGAVTVVVPKSKQVPECVTGPFETIGLRIPNCPYLWEFFKMVPGGVLATTSANLSDQPESLQASEVFAAFGNQVDYLLMQDGLGSGQASTVVSVERDGTVKVLRQGSIVID